VTGRPLPRGSAQAPLGLAVAGEASGLWGAPDRLVGRLLLQYLQAARAEAVLAAVPAGKRPVTAQARDVLGRALGFRMWCTLRHGVLTTPGPHQLWGELSPIHPSARPGPVAVVPPGRRAPRGP
jgi:hypothetical protein